MKKKVNDRFKNNQGSLRHVHLNKQTERALRENGKYFKEITEKFSDIIIITDKDGNIKYCSLSVERFTGYKPKELIGKSVFAFIHPDDVQPAAEDYGKAIQSDENAIIPNTFRLIHKNASVIYLDGLGRNLLSDPEIAGFVMNLRDVTERRKMEEKLKKSEEQYRLLADHMSDYVWLMDLSLMVTYISPSLERLLGFTIDNFKELPLNKILKTSSFIKSINFLSTEIPHAQHSSPDHVLNKFLELEFQSKDDHIIWGECRFSFIHDDRDKSVSILGEGRNITERKQMENALRESEHNFRHSLDESPLGVRISTVDGETLYANKAILDIYGYDDVEELKRASIKERYTSESYIEFQIRKKRRLKGEDVPSEYDISIVRKNGEIRHLHVFRKEIFWSGKKQSQVIYQDITGRKEAEEKLRTTLENLRQSIKATIQVLSMASEAKDPYIAGHQKRVADLARAIARENGLPQDKIEGIRMAGAIHDIGKLSVPGEILAKSTKLNNIEYSLVKQHSQNGYEILKHVESPWPLAQIVQQHHERMDGTGYPNKLKGDDILIEARIMGVADVVEAMASHRPYRPALGIRAALEEIEKNKGILYDKDVVDACVTLFQKGYTLS